MNRYKAAVVIALGAALGACQQQGPDKKAADAQALEKRIAALEQQAPPSSAAPADPAAVNMAPEPAAPAPVAPAETKSATSTARTRSRTAATHRNVQTAHRAPAPTAPTAPSRTAAERVERVGPAAEPIEPIEPMVGTGDPGPRRDTLVIPSGTEMRIVLETGLSSETSKPGERVVARVERAMDKDGRVVLPGGTVLRGRVVRADSAGRIRGRSHLSVDFDRIVVRGQEHPLRATAIDVDGPDDTRRDAAIIGGSTVAGAVLGGIMNKGAKKGAIIGAATGAGAVLVTKGEAIEMPSGSRWTVRVTNTVRLD